MKLNINNEAYDVPDSPQRVLLWVLRDELGLSGTKFGCGAGICGACTVHVDGVATRSCITPLANLEEGTSIRTVEGLHKVAENGTIELHPVQEAFIEVQVPQCSWCMSGQMMTAAAFLEGNPNPSQDEIVDAMSRNYCRCGCYYRIKSAVAKAGELMRA